MYGRPYGYGHGVGFYDPDAEAAAEAVRLSALVHSIGMQVGAAMASHGKGKSYDAFPSAMGLGKTWKDIFRDIHAITDQAVMTIGPAIDGLTDGASQPATHHAWTINQQIAAMPVGWTAKGGDNANEPFVRSAAYMAGQIQGIYSGALAARAPK